MAREILGPGWAPTIMQTQSGALRIYHQYREGARLHMMMRESQDGVSWSQPVSVRSQIENEGASWGTSVMDLGAGVADPSKRFKNVHYWIGPGQNGAYVDNSPDGIVWEAPSSRVTPVVASADQLSAFRVLGGGYGLFTKVEIAGLYPRETWASFGDGDFRNWTQPVRAFWRDPLDPPDVEFYGATNVIAQGSKLITFVRVLRDTVERGQGYTVMAWSLDNGQTWTRSREPFFKGCPGELDQAHAWIYGVVDRAGTLYFTYSAYPIGHKTGPRYVGVATMPIAGLKIGSNNGPSCT